MSFKHSPNIHIYISIYIVCVCIYVFVCLFDAGILEPNWPSMASDVPELLFGKDEITFF